MKSVKKLSIYTAMLAAGLTAGQAANADGSGLYVMPNVGIQVFDEDKNSDDGTNYGLNLGYEFNSPWALELGYHGGEAETEGGTEFDTELLNLDALYRFNRGGRFEPFILTGLGDQKIKFDNVDDQAETVGSLGVGAYVGLTDRVRLRGDVRGLYSFDNEATDVLALLGVQFRFGSGYGSQQEVVVEEEVVTEAIVLDTDGDGVLDSNDQCNSTPVGISVDANGCMFDSDADGIADSLDQCSGTAAGVSVDTKGCMLDADSDGVADSIDQCDDTMPGAKIDATGCNVKLVADVSYNLNIEFSTGSSAIQPQYQNDVSELADFLKQYPTSVVHIEGYTDSRGSAVLNQRLSQKRAQSVVDELVNAYGIDPSRIEAKGYGEANPIESNDTAAGRKANRRVVAVVKAKKIIQ